MSLLATKMGLKDKHLTWFFCISSLVILEKLIIILKLQGILKNFKEFQLRLLPHLIKTISNVFNACELHKLTT